MGGRKPTVSDDEILDTFREVDEPFLSTREVADHIGISRSGTYTRLVELRKNGHLRSKNYDQLILWQLDEDNS